MRIAIIGAGAMGGLLGFYLADQADLVLVDPWIEHVAAINRTGLIGERDGSIEARTLYAVTDPTLAAPADLALVLVKAAQTPWAARACQLALAADGIAYTLQNGLGHREILAELLGEERTGQGVTALGATLLGPGRIRHAGMGATILGADPNPERATLLCDLLSRSGLPASVSHTIESLVWGKLLVNVGINALTALLRLPNGLVATNPTVRALAAAAVAEAATIAQARGIQLPYSDAVGHMLAVAEATATNRSSMLQDLLRGAPTEIAAINGAIVREGARLELPTPINTMLSRLIEALEATADQRV